MHGRVKERTSEEKKAIIHKQQQAKLKAYTQGIDTIFSQRKLNECDNNTLLLISKLLCNNPDIYTLWNIRREILLKGEKQVKQEVVANELGLTEECLRANPKSYSAWHHRCWVLDNCPEPDWQKEVDLCAKYLKLDERNFHCWDYRQFVVNRAKVSYEDELKFSTEKILQNFSNYSSWHYRSILYKTLSPKSDLFKEELDLVQNAAFTDPNDTSAWFYQRWLLGKCENPLKVLLAFCNKNIAVVSLTKLVEKPPYFYINNTQTAVNFQPFDENGKCSNIWVSFNIPSNINFDQDLINISLDNETLIKLEYDVEHKELRYAEKNPISLGVSFSEEIRPILLEQLDSCRGLLDLEPDSKWTLLTTALLMRGLGGLENNLESIDMIDKLKDIDHLRKGYYNDLRSQWVLNDFLNNFMEVGSLFNDIIIDDDSITALYNNEYFLGSLNISVSSKMLYDKLILKFSKFQRSTIHLLG